MKISKLIVLILAFISFFVSVSFANRIEIYDSKQRNFSIDESIINKKLDSIQNNYGLNVDIAVLGDDKAACRTSTYIASCVESEYQYVSDIFAAIVVELPTDNYKGIETYRKDDWNFIIDTYDIKSSIQEKSTPYFKEADYNGGIIRYLDELDIELGLLCENTYQHYETVYAESQTESEKMNKSCVAFDLKDIYYETLRLEKEIAMAKKEASTKKILTYIIVSIVLGFALYMLFAYFQTTRYTNKCKDILKDIKFYKIELKEQDTFFPEDKQKLSKLIMGLERELETYLGNMDKNWRLLSKQYNLFDKQKEIIIRKREKAIYDYTHQDELEKEIDDFKGINL